MLAQPWAAWSFCGKSPNHCWDMIGSSTESSLTLGGIFFANKAIMMKRPCHDSGFLQVLLFPEWYGCNSVNAEFIAYVMLCTLSRWPLSKFARASMIWAIEHDGRLQSHVKRLRENERCIGFHRPIGTTAKRKLANLAIAAHNARLTVLKTMQVSGATDCAIITNAAISGPPSWTPSFSRESTPLSSAMPTLGSCCMHRDLLWDRAFVFLQDSPFAHKQSRPVAFMVGSWSTHNPHSCAT